MTKNVSRETFLSKIRLIGTNHFRLKMLALYTLNILLKKIRQSTTLPDFLANN